MTTSKSVTAWLTERGLGLDQLVEQTGLDPKVVDAILHGRYTPSPQQRGRIAAALGVAPEQVAWGHVNEVQHLHGHGPQFGRTP